MRYYPCTMAISRNCVFVYTSAYTVICQMVFHWQGLIALLTLGLNFLFLVLCAQTWNTVHTVGHIDFNVNRMQWTCKSLTSCGGFILTTEQFMSDRMFEQVYFQNVRENLIPTQMIWERHKGNAGSHVSFISLCKM